MRIDGISELSKKCTGCLACIDACPKGCISPITGEDGFVYSRIDASGCIDCGKCYNVCPIENHKKHSDGQHLYAAYARNKITRNGGSSGGMFELLARRCLDNGFYVCGAAFDGVTLRHSIINTAGELPRLLKSKYLQSDTSGIFAKIKELLSLGERVFFCGTPCQVSALINTLNEREREGLLTADIICHGVPSQTTFNRYIKSLEHHLGGEVARFSFRVKDNRYRHAHGYSFDLLKDGRTKTINGIYTDSSFYNAFKNYSIFRESCYNCRYTTLNRVSDITLGDFWGIEKYGFDGNTDTGVSLLLTNTPKGEEYFGEIKEATVWQEYPIEYAVESNHCLTHSTKKPDRRDRIIGELATEDYDAVAKRYFGSRFIERAFWLLPPCLRNLYRKIRRG